MSRGNVFIVDDDPLIRASLEQLLEALGYDSHAYPSAESYLNNPPSEPVGCLILDLQLGAMSGLELQLQLREQGDDLPIIFLTGHANVSIAVEAVKRGAFDFLEKPFEADRLIDLVALAIEESHNQAHRRDLLKQLTSRERDVFDLLTAGMINKIIAAKLGISIKTVEFHRSRLMEKLKARGLDDLIALTRSGGDAALRGSEI